MTNKKIEEELIEASKNCDLEKVKNLVETNKFDNNTLEKAESEAQNISCSKVVDYLQDIMGKNRGKELIKNCRRILNSQDYNGGMNFGKSNFKIDSNPPDDDNNDNNDNYDDNDNDINKQIW